uniref:Glycoprotein nmb n=1 Tax=Callorhinchus milii TaxID=7868 RepID=A0A4W3JQR0_CALMI
MLFRYRDVLTHGRKLFFTSRHSIHLPGWLPDSNSWDDQIYPSWRKNDIRWKHCWKGGKVVAHLTNDGPTLVGANVTFAVMLEFPKCQKEDDNGDIIYDSNCKNASSFFPGQYVYNWTSWIDDYGWFNCTKFTKCNIFPDGHPVPRHTEWRRKNFIYIWHTQGQYYQQTGGSKMMLSVNTTNITLADHMMELSVYRKNHHGKNKYIPITTASDPYTVTDKIPVFVTISQKSKCKNDENVYIKNLKMIFNVKIQDPSNYLKKAAITYRWNFDDGNESVSKVRTTTHNYTMLGQYTPTLTVEAIIPVPCSSIKTTTMSPTTTTPNPTSGRIKIVGICKMQQKFFLSLSDGILEMKIVQMTSVQVATQPLANSMVDFVVTCNGSIPTDVCTVIADKSCMVPKNIICDPIKAADICHFTLRRGFNQSGIYCVNITLSDNTSLAVASTLVSVKGMWLFVPSLLYVMRTINFLDFTILDTIPFTSIPFFVLLLFFLSGSPATISRSSLPLSDQTLYVHIFKAFFIQTLPCLNHCNDS